MSFRIAIHEGFHLGIPGFILRVITVEIRGGYSVVISLGTSSNIVKFNNKFHYYLRKYS